MRQSVESGSGMGTSRRTSAESAVVTPDRGPALNLLAQRLRHGNSLLHCDRPRRSRSSLRCQAATPTTRSLNPLGPRRLRDVLLAMLPSLLRPSQDADVPARRGWRRRPTLRPRAGPGRPGLRRSELQVIRPGRRPSPAHSRNDPVACRRAHSRGRAGSLGGVRTAGASWSRDGPQVPAPWAQIRIGRAIACVLKDEPDGAVDQPVT